MVNVATVTLDEREKMEQALQEAENCFNSIFETTSDGVLIIDSETGKIRSGNAAICALLGYTSEELIQLTLKDIHPKESIERILHEFDLHREGIKTSTDDVPFQRKDGSIGYADIRTTTVGVEGHRCVMGFFRDISVRKHIEEDREQLKKKLEDALTKVLSGFLPICANCKKIRDDNGDWVSVESYIKMRTEAKFTHGICPHCMMKLYPELVQ